MTLTPSARNSSAVFSSSPESDTMMSASPASQSRIGATTPNFDESPTKIFFSEMDMSARSSG